MRRLAKRVARSRRSPRAYRELVVVSFRIAWIPDRGAWLGARGPWSGCFHDPSFYSLKAAGFIDSTTLDQPCVGRAGPTIIVALGDRDGELINGYGFGAGASVHGIDAMGPACARADRHDVDLQPAICLDPLYQAAAGN